MKDRRAKRIRNRREGTEEFNRKTGKYRYVAELANGRRVCGSWSATRLAARESLQARLDSIEPAKQLGKPTLQAFAQSVLEGPYKTRLLAGTLEQKTWEQYEQCWRLRLHGTVLGMTPVDVVTSEMVDDWSASTMTELVVRMDKKSGIERVAVPPRPMSAWGRLKDLTFLRGVFRLAVKARLRGDNPVVEAERPQPGETAFRTLTRLEFGRLLSLAQRFQGGHNYGKWKEQSPDPRRVEMLVWLMAHGLGPSEAAGVKRSWLRLDGQGRPVMDIVSGAKEGESTGRLKTRNRYRTIPIWPELWNLAKNKPEGFLLATSTGTAIRTENLRRLWASLVKGSEFEGMDPYDLRHTYAQMLLDSGVDVRTGAELMGNTPEVFLRRYVRSDMERKHRAMAEAKPTPEPTPTNNVAYSE